MNPRPRSETQTSIPQMCKVPAESEVFDFIIMVHSCKSFKTSKGKRHKKKPRLSRVLDRTVTDKMETDPLIIVVALRVPLFWHTNPAAWFRMFEGPPKPHDLITHLSGRMRRKLTLSPTCLRITPNIWTQKFVD